MQTQTGSGFVDQVDGLVGQETVADVTYRELHGRDDSLVEDTDVMVVLVTFLQATKDGNGRGFVRLVDHDDLETTFQRLVFLEILLVFLQCGGADALQLASRQSWLQDVGGIHGAACGTRTHQGVYLIDEQHHFAGTFHHLLDDTLQTFLKLALVFCTCNQGTHVEREHFLAFQVFRHVAVDDTLCQSLYDGGLAHAGFTNQDRVVFRTARQDLQHTPYLLVTSNHGIQFARFRQLIQIFGVTV